MHRLREIQSLQMHRIIAEKLELDPKAVIGKALANLHAWMSRREGASAITTLQEWLEFLESASPAEAASLIVSDSERATRLWQSSPFAGVLTPQEVWAIKRAAD